MRIRLTSEDIGYITAFEELTNAKVKNFLFRKKTLYFIVETDGFGALIGKNGENIKKLQNKMKKNIRVIKYSPEPETFITNLINVSVKEIKILKKGKTSIAHVKIESRDKAVVIGHRGNNINIMNEILKKNTAIEKIVIDS